MTALPRNLLRSGFPALILPADLTSRGDCALLTSKIQDGRGLELIGIDILFV